MKKVYKKITAKGVLQCFKRVNGSPMSAQDIATQRGTSNRMASEVLNALRVQGLVKRFIHDEQVVYSLADWHESHEEFMLRIESLCKVNEEGCVVWQNAARDANFGPELKFNDKRLKVRRFLYERKHGMLPTSTCLLMTCETPGCVCVECMKPITRGKWCKGLKRSLATRLKFAARNVSRKVSDESRADILYGSGTQVEKAARNGISQQAVSQIMRRQFSHVVVAGSMFGQLVAAPSRASR